MTTSNPDHHHFKDPAFAGKVGETSSLGVVNFPVWPFLHLSSYLSHLSLYIIKYFLLLSFIQFFLNVFSKSFKIKQIVICVLSTLSAQFVDKQSIAWEDIQSFCQLHSDVVSVEHVDQNVDTSHPSTHVRPCDLPFSKLLKYVEVVLHWIAHLIRRSWLRQKQVYSQFS